MLAYLGRAKEKPRESGVLQKTRDRKKLTIVEGRELSAEDRKAVVTRQDQRL